MVKFAARSRAAAAAGQPSSSAAKPFLKQQKTSRAARTKPSAPGMVVFNAWDRMLT